MEYEYMGMTDKQYDGLLKDHIASLDRLASKHQDNIEMLKDIYAERELVIQKLGYDIDEKNLYNQLR